MTNVQKERELGSEIYLDANVFIYGTLDEGEIGDKARKIINDVKDGKYEAHTSSLTIDEVLWRVQKIVGKEKAAAAASDFLTLLNLNIISVDRFIVTEAISSYLKEKLDPRDAIHLAAMKSKKLKKILSSDSDFDKVDGIKRIDFSKG